MAISNSEWQRVVERMNTIESKKNRVILVFKMKQKTNLVPEESYSIFYAIYNY